MAIADLQKIIKAASRAMPKNMILTGEGTQNERYVKNRHLSGVASSAGSLSMLDLIPRAPETSNRAVSQPAGQSESLAAAMVRSSRFMQAGARLIPLRAGDDSQGSVSGVPVWSTSPGSFTIIEGANFQPGDELSPLSPSALPVSTEDIDRDLIQSHGVRFEIDRRTQKDLSPEELNARLVNAIAFGIGRAVDKIALAKLADKLLEAGGGAEMPTYSLAAAAGVGLRFGELSAIVGTDATGATVENGVLRVSGIPAEMTGENANTFVGAFDRSAVAVMDDIRVLVERLDVNGKMAVTCWLDVLPLVPDAAFFWRAA